MAHKASFLKRGSYVVVAIIRLSCKWASVSRYLYFDLMYTMQENVVSHTYVERGPKLNKSFCSFILQHAYFFGAFNHKLAKSESSNWIFWFSSSCNSATSKAKSPQASASTRNGNWTCRHDTSSLRKCSLKFACKFVNYWTRSCFTLGNDISLSVVARTSLSCGNKPKSPVFARVMEIASLLTKARMEVCSSNTHLPRPCSEIFSSFSFSKTSVKSARQAMNRSEKSCIFIFPVVQETFYFIPEDKTLQCTTAWKPPHSRVK